MSDHTLQCVVWLTHAGVGVGEEKSCPQRKLSHPAPCCSHCSHSISSETVCHVKKSGVNSHSAGLSSSPSACFEPTQRSGDGRWCCAFGRASPLSNENTSLFMEGKCTVRQEGTPPPCIKSLIGIRSCAFASLGGFRQSTSFTPRQLDLAAVCSLWNSGC